MGTKIHLAVLDQAPVSEGSNGCDYAWNGDFTAYRSLFPPTVGASDGHDTWQSRDAAVDAAFDRLASRALATTRVAQSEIDTAMLDAGWDEK